MIDLASPPPPAELPPHDRAAAAVRRILEAHPLLEPLRSSGAPEWYGPWVGCHDGAIWVRIGSWQAGEYLEAKIEGERWWEAPAGVGEEQAEYLADRLAAELRAQWRGQTGVTTTGTFGGEDGAVGGEP